VTPTKGMHGSMGTTAQNNQQKDASATNEKAGKKD